MIELWSLHQLYKVLHEWRKETQLRMMNGTMEEKRLRLRFSNTDMQIMYDEGDTQITQITLIFAKGLHMSQILNYNNPTVSTMVELVFY